MPNQLSETFGAATLDLVHDITRNKYATLSARNPDRSYSEMTPAEFTRKLNVAQGALAFDIKGHGEDFNLSLRYDPKQSGKPHFTDVAHTVEQSEEMTATVRGALGLAPLAKPEVRARLSWARRIGVCFSQTALTAPVILKVIAALEQVVPDGERRNHRVPRRGVPDYTPIPIDFGGLTPL